MPDHSDLIKRLRTTENWRGVEVALLMQEAAEALSEARARASTDLEYIRHLEGRAKAAESRLAAPLPEEVQHAISCLSGGERGDQIADLLARLARELAEAKKPFRQIKEKP